MVEEVPMKPLLLLALTAVAAWGQGTASLRARELFYTPPPGASSVKPPAAPAPAPKTIAKKTPAKAPAPSQPLSSVPTQDVVDKPASGPLGMRYSVLKRNAAGEYQEVDADTVFHSGDRIRLEAQANSTGYLYVVAQGSSGNWQVLFPSREVSNGSNQVHRGETRMVPAGNQGQFVFDEQPGTEKLFFVLSRVVVVFHWAFITLSGVGMPPKGNDESSSPFNARLTVVLLALNVWEMCEFAVIA